MFAFTPIIQSLLEFDLYKLTMWQPMLHQLSGNRAKYRFVCRNTPEFPLSELAVPVREQIEHLCSLRFTPNELDYLRTRRYLKSDFIDFLGIFQFQSRFISVRADGDALEVEADGPQVHTTGFEIYVLAIINELYFRRLLEIRGLDMAEVLDEGRARLAQKIEQLRSYGRLNAGAMRHPFEFFDFGLRRRFSGAWQDEVVGTLAREVPEFFKGTSNVYLARKHNLVPIGTMAHEWLQTFQGTGVQLRQFQKAALEAWVQEYRGDLGVALTDVVGMDAFLADFDLYFAKLFDGLRHDSGDPKVWGEKALAYYASNRIDPHSKRLVFSDGLKVSDAIELHEYFGNRIQTGFGIGTSLTNDLGLKPLNIVMKLVSCNGQPTAKLSDTPGKTLCDDQTFLAYLRQVFNKHD